MELALVCRSDNDLYRVLCDSGLGCSRYDSTAAALSHAADSSGLMVLADGYPESLTPAAGPLYEEAARKHIRLYVEFPASLPDVDVRPVRGIRWERAVVASDAFGAELRRLRILMIHGCRLVEVAADHPHLVLARVAGFDTAVYGLPDRTHAILFEHPCGNLLVSTTMMLDAYPERWQ